MATSDDDRGLATAPVASAANGFAELHCISNFSFLCGASHPEELVQRAAELGYRGIAITDECSFAGVVRAHIAAKQHGIAFVVGTEITFEDVGITLVLLAPTRAAYGRLSSLVTVGRRAADKGSYRLTLADVGQGLPECLALWIPRADEFRDLMSHGRLLKQRFPRLWIALELLQEGDDLDLAAEALTLSMRLDLPIVATNDVHMHVPERKPLWDVLTATRLKTTVSELGSRSAANSERHLRPLARLEQIYPQEMLTETVSILARCTFSLDELRYEYPEELVPAHLTPAQHLRALTFAGAAERWPDGIPQEVNDLIEKELRLIAELRYEHYFLTVHDIVQFARRESILCQGRGSAANSAVCYCLRITEVDPSRMHLLFERFVSKERHEPPDIDVDFEHERREEVIQYLYSHYGRDRAALAATLITYRPKSAIRDVGKALGLDLSLVDLLARSLSWWDSREVLEARCAAAGVDLKSPRIRQFLALVDEVLGFPRHLSQHVGGFVISRGPLDELVPIENATMADRTVIEWDKDDLDALGLLKVDVLGLGMLTAIRKSLEHRNAYRRDLPALSVESIPAEDPETYRMLQRGDSVGVFQVESRAQMAMLPRLKPSSFYDLVIEVAIVRPGPIQGNMVHPYLRRRQGLEQVTYSNDAVRKVLERTLGVPIFQEQVIELAMVAAGFGAGEADRLRRAMAAWRRRGGLEQFEQKLIDGMLERGHDRDFAERVFAQIKGFGEYGFPESHAASFALLVYVSAWLKRHEPAAFCCGLLNSLPMGFYSPSQLVQDVERHGVDVRDVDVQWSTYDHSLEDDDTERHTLYPCRKQPAIRLGFRLVKGLSEEAGRRIERARASSPFADVGELARRAELTNGDLECLARAGALESLSGHRYQAHWNVAGVTRPPSIWHVAETPFDDDPSDGETLDGPTVGQDLIADYRYLGLTLGPHPMTLLRGHPELDGCRAARDLVACQHGRFVKIAGLVTCRQRPSTSSGVVFLTVEDETGNSNVVVWTSVLERYRAALLQGRLIKIKGVIEREGEVIHVVAGHVEDVTHLLNSLANEDVPMPFTSRDFH
jgi:error-prone DNA polymerase